MLSLNLDVTDYLPLGRLKIFPLRAMQAKTGESHNLLTPLLDALRRQVTQDLMIIDSITSFIAHASIEQIVGFFEEIMAYCSKGMTIALITHSYAFTESTLVRISSMCDAHLCLKTENVGDPLRKRWKLPRCAAHSKARVTSSALTLTPASACASPPSPRPGRSLATCPRPLERRQTQFVCCRLYPRCPLPSPPPRIHPCAPGVPLGVE
ncbi:MAG: hypothetical protein EXR49_01320 [Dehalococcoidia bacterium]|nr:hypothetical protein [Dehalococcoidia bacterium]